MNKNTTGRKSDGEGTIYFDAKEGRWHSEIQWSDKRGEKHRKKFSGKKKTIVKNKLEEFKKQLLITEGDIKKNDISFEDFSNHWMNSVLKNKLKPSSYNRKQVTLENQVYPFLGTIPINKITHSDVQDMINELVERGLSYSTIKKAYEAVNACCREYRIRSGEYFNPCEGVTLPVNIEKNISDIKFFNEEQRKAIIKEATRKYKTGKPVYRMGSAIVALMYTGLRVGELVALTWDDIDFDNKTISVSKNAVTVRVNEEGKPHYQLITQNSTKTFSGKRIIPMTKMAYSAFQDIYKVNKNNDYVISTQNNKQINPRSIDEMFYSILKHANLAKDKSELCGVHSLRHTFASMLFQNGCDVKVVSEILGHSDTKITENIYIHVIQDQKVKAIQDIDKYSC